MRKLTLEKLWEAEGANFGQAGGAQCVADFGNADAEYGKLRNSAALCDFSFTQRLSFDESDGIDFLDSMLAANILKLRYGRITDTYLADEYGNIRAEVLAGNIDDKIIAVLESLDDSCSKCLSDGSAQCSDLTDSHILLSVAGPDSWKVAVAVFGTDILNLPFMSVEKYRYEDADTYLMRSGKTGEYGYQFMAPNAIAEKLAKRLLEESKKLGGGLCGMAAHALARLDGNFFNIYGEGARVLNPLKLGLQWMTDFEKEKFPGSEKIYSERDSGISQKICAVQSAGDTPLNPGDKIFDSDDEVGEVVHALRSPISGKWTGLALMKSHCAFSGFGFSRTPNGGEEIFTVSRPTVLAKSLSKPMLQE